MARSETGLTHAERGEDRDGIDNDETPYQGFPASAVPDKPGREREYTLDRIERTIGSIL
ncbi:MULTISPECIES: hypothetical protein [unclassified Roseovarius]|uniref:hypothetical protein n=1 Tax=unclassified Roseovarius TaxID=2614913 RepID=UPI00273F5997|nr:hypothetical protein [Roseovarius sp. MMSF_3350]